jgi:hypothetical protein
MHTAPVSGSAEAGVQLADRTIESGVEVFGARFGSHHGASGRHGDLDALTDVGLAWIAFVEKLHVHSDEFLVVPFDFAQLVGNVFPIMIGNLYVAALDDNVHS